MEIEQRALILWDVLLDVDYKNEKLIASFHRESAVSFKGVKAGKDISLLLNIKAQTITMDAHPETEKQGSVTLPADFIRSLKAGPGYLDQLTFSDPRHRPVWVTEDMRERLDGKLPTVQLGTTNYTVDLQHERLIPSDGKGTFLYVRDMELMEMGEAPPVYTALYDDSSRKLVNLAKERVDLSMEIYQVHLPELITLDPVGYAQHRYGTWPHVLLKDFHYQKHHQVSEKINPEDLAAILKRDSLLARGQTPKETHTQRTPKRRR